MKEENNIEKLFQGAFENFEVTPPVSVKMEIDKQLDAKKIKLRWIFWWSTIVILLLTGVAFAVVKGDFYNAAPRSELPASDQRSSDSDRYSKDEKTSGETSDGLADKQYEHVEKTSSESESSMPEKLTTESQTAAKNELTEKSNSVPANSVKTNSKKKTTHSVNKGSAKTTKIKTDKMDGPVNGKKGNSGEANQTTTQIKKNGSTPKNTLKTSPKKKSRFKKEVNAGKEGVNASGGSTIEKPGAEKNQLPETAEKQKEGSTEPKIEKGPAAADPEKGKEPADSLANVAAIADSTDKPEPETPAVKTPKDDSKARNWMVEIYGGPRFDSKTSKTDFALKSANSYQIGLGFSRNLNLGPLKYVTLGGEYGAGKESYRQETTTTSIYLAGVDSIPVLDSSMTDTLYYIGVDNYDTLNQTTELTNNAQITRFAFGLRTEFNFNLGSGFGLAVSPGYYYSRSKYKFADSSSTSSSSQILLGLSVYYDWNRFRFRVGLDSRYELMGKNQNAYIDRRKSVLFSPQFGIGFKF